MEKKFWGGLSYKNEGAARRSSYLLGVKVFNVTAKDARI